MTTAAPSPHPESRTAETQPPPKSLPARLWSAGQLIVSLALTAAFLAYLLRPTPPPPAASTERQPPPPEAVQAVGPYLIRIQPDTPIAHKLKVADVHPTRIHSAVLGVTGTVVASLRPGAGKGGDYWQFNTPEVLTAYTDWQKATADITFAETQLESVKELAEARVASQKKVVARLERLVTAGTDTPKDLDLERNNLLQFQIAGRKEVHEAQTAVRLARRNEAALARQLQLAGLDPAMLKSLSSDVDVVMADVPEGFLERVKVGQGCEARFFGIPHQVFDGKVRSIAPVISKERRSLRVLFTINDLHDQLRTGMFAEIGLGTDPRDALLVPAEGVIHVGRADYLLVGTGTPDEWRVTEVQVGEPQSGRIEILRGLKPGDRVLGNGAILLKPVLVVALPGAEPQPAANHEGDRQ